MGDLRLDPCLQGGGIRVDSGTVTITASSITGNTAVGRVRAHLRKFPIAPTGDSCLVRCLQGAGVFVTSGTVSIVNSQVYSNQVDNIFVRAHAQKFPSP